MKMTVNDLVKSTGEDLMKLTDADLVKTTSEDLVTSTGENLVKTTDEDLAQLLDMRSELVEERAAKEAVQAELHTMLLQLHSTQLQIHNLRGMEVDADDIQKKLENELSARQKVAMSVGRLDAELKSLRRENQELRQYILALQSEVYGARLAAKYLDKELAGRIQQIQLLGRDMRGAEHDKLWNQLEAEIHLHRHKTVIRACRGRANRKKKLPIPPGHDFQTLKRKHGLGDMRKVVLQKGPEEGLGMSITQGEISMEVMFVAPDEDSDDDNNEYEDEHGFRSGNSLASPPLTNYQPPSHR
nr:hypothetical protein BaRGS_022936 [Batillaria attramentaria]